MQLIPTSKELLKVFLQDLPREPGIYKFLNERKLTIYIGKAKNLKNRVPSYFQESNDKTKKIKNMIRESKFLEIALTKNELEALLLEQYLIKEIKPKFNVQFKDDKGYPWIRIDTSNNFPSAKSFLGRRHDKEKYFGPYPSSYALKEALNVIQKTFKLRNCSDSFFKNRSRPCMQYEIGRCSAPCVDYITRTNYLREVKNTELLLLGKSEEIVDELYLLMDKSSDEKSYELAATYRDRISALRDVQRNQSITGYSKERDAVFLASLNGVTKVGVTHVNRGWVTGHENFNLKTMGVDESLIGSFIKGHYLSKIFCPPVIIIDENFKERNSVEIALSKYHSKAIKIQTKLGKKDKGLLEIAKSNTRLALKKSTERGVDISISLELLKNELCIKRDIKIIESYDVSHHSGSSAVGGCVVYSQKGKLKDKYRLFNISAQNSGDDISSMKEVIKRRFQNKTLGLDFPSLLLIDGGKIHLQAVKKTIDSLNIKDVELLSISKGVRRKAQMDSIHKVDGTVVRVNKGSTSHLLLQEIRDETHRFSISNQKKKQAKISLRSSLDDIIGMGSIKKNLVLRYFGSLEQIERASLRDLVQVDGIGPKTAQLIYNYFH